MLHQYSYWPVSVGAAGSKSSLRSASAAGVAINHVLNNVQAVEFLPALREMLTFCCLKASEAPRKCGPCRSEGANK
jgi:hypothetical protein